MCAKYHFLIIFTVTVTLLLNACVCIQINYTKVPKAIRNNTGEHVILDCDYSVRPDDGALVVKWFLNDQLVYQWIPPKKPFSLGPLKNRLDLNFKATGEPFSAHRALKILNPTTDIAGKYECLVSTFSDEDTDAKTMIVFEPERSLILERGESDSTHQNFTCQAVDAYPQPALYIYKDGEQQQSPTYDSLTTVKWVTEKGSEGRFTVTVTSTIKSSNLEYGSLIFCEMRIPGTGYSKRQSLLYYPPGSILTATCRHIVITLFLAGMIL